MQALPERCLMDGSFPIGKATTSHYYKRKRETLSCYVKYTYCSLSVLMGWQVVTRDVLWSFPSAPNPL